MFVNIICIKIVIFLGLMMVLNFVIDYFIGNFYYIVEGFIKYESYIGVVYRIIFVYKILILNIFKLNDIVFYLLKGCV